MEIESIREHWTSWARTFGANLRATTKTPTAKTLELDALARRFYALLGPDADALVLEMGCGNGINCVELAKLFTSARFHGIDLIPEMIDSARENATAGGVADRAEFFCGDATAIGAVDGLSDAYDLIFTVRCLINLNTAQAQGAAIASLAATLKPGGHLLMVENSTATHGAQNDYRELLELPRRKPAEFNRFFSEEEMRGHIENAGLDLLDVEDFSSLHDLILYVLVPATNGGSVDYEHPLVRAATELSTKVSADHPSAFGRLGQNRLFVCSKPA